MKIIRVMVNGIPGNMATLVAEHLLRDPCFELVPFSLTGPDITESSHRVLTTSVQLIHPKDREKKMPQIDRQDLISVDYTHPGAVNGNTEFYCNNHLPFVMGTTGGDRRLMEETVCRSKICAVISPNMAKPIVGFQAMMAYAAQAFPNLFRGYTLIVKESHQKGKADTSGTAKAMVAYFNQLGIPFEENKIIKERRPDIQKTTWGIPEAFLGGHGWHTYSLLSADKTVKMEFTHNVNGRDVYAVGTLYAVLYLERKIRDGAKGRVFSMMDVLKGA
jgi:4-hydroxy-tetrahydrodipicolinate reductase